MFTKDDFIAAMVKVERAVDMHDGLRRRTLGPGFSLPAKITVERDGFTIEIDVLPGDLRKRRHSTIHSGSCETPMAAADDLIAHLHIWAKAIA